MTLAEKFWRFNVKEEEKEEDDSSIWVILYKFEVKKPHFRFWKNLKELMKRDETLKLWKNAAYTENERGALAVASLVEHYKGEFKVVRGNQINFYDIPSLNVE